MFLRIYLNLSLGQAAVPSRFKTTTIVPIPKSSAVTCYNDYRPVALTPIIMKHFERLALSYLRSSMPLHLDKFQFAYPAKKDPQTMQCLLLRIPLTLLECSHSSYWQTSEKVKCFGHIPTAVFMDYRFPNRPQMVRTGDQASKTIILSTGVPQWCVLIPVLFTHESQILWWNLLKFALVWLIWDNGGDCL